MLHCNAVVLGNASRPACFARNGDSLDWIKVAGSSAGGLVPKREHPVENDSIAHNDVRFGGVRFSDVGLAQCGLARWALAQE
jgi:hypothetical protein